ncbi:MAG: amidase, partial [Pseudomonadota bacterium]
MSPAKALALAGAIALAGCAHRADVPMTFDVVEADIPLLQQALAEGRVSSRQLVQAYLARIELHQRTLNAVASVNPHALEEADTLDRERAA